MSEQQIFFSRQKKKPLSNSADELGQQIAIGEMLCPAAAEPAGLRLDQPAQPAQPPLRAHDHPPHRPQEGKAGASKGSVNLFVAFPTLCRPAPAPG